MSPEQQRGHRLTGVRAGRAVSSNRSHNSQPLFFFFKAGEICSDETAQSIMSIEDKRRAILLKRELKGPDSCLLGPLPPPMMQPESFPHQMSLSDQEAEAQGHRGLSEASWN